MLCDGEMVHHLEGGQYTTQILTTHLKIPGSNPLHNLKTLLSLRKYNEAYKICEKLSTNDAWLEYGRKALFDLEPKIALRAYRNISDVAMVKALEKIGYFEDLNILTGFCCMMLGINDEAEQYFLRGAYTKEALDICRDLLQWEQALLLAHKFKPNEVPFLAREYAQQLEYSKAINVLSTYHLLNNE